MAERITYYGTPETIYDENVDFVKGASLTGSEVDMNFNTLEGRSIKKAELSGDVLEIKLENGETVKCDLAGVAALKEISFEYDSRNGKLLVFTNNHRHPIVVEGFFSEHDFHKFKSMGVLSDDTITGNGTPKHPLSLSPLFRPGMLKSVIAYTDELPADATAGDRYVTTENIDTYGALYNYKGVLNIIEHLEGTGWRVAEKSDWDDMLNALEPSKADRNHHIHDCNMYLGESANHYLTDNAHNFNAVYCGYAYEEEELHVVYEGSRTCWWTATHDANKSAYIKRIDNFTDGVFQDIVDGENFNSVRLVRDIDPDEVTGPETIMGRTYLTTVMPSMRKGLRLWTATNFTSNLVPVMIESDETTQTTDCDGNTVTVTTTRYDVIDDMSDAIYRPSEYPAYQSVNFISEWNGERWVKQRIDEYDSFYVKELGGFYYMSGNELVSVTDTTPIDLGPRVETLEGAVAEISSQIQNHDARISDLEDITDGNADTLEQVIREMADMTSRMDEVNNMATVAAGQATIAINSIDGMMDTLAELVKDVADLKQFHSRDFAELYLKKAEEYTYDDGYIYYGEIECDGTVVSYTLSADKYAQDNRRMVYDLGRFLGAIYRTSEVPTIVYNGTDYTWDTEGTLKGSNYKDSDGNTLVHDITIGFASGHNADGSWTFVLGIVGTDVTVNIELT